ncbi:TPA: host nuclease inhibitor GamL [Escherichia coli]|nr:host nuclease inhibitor GamL [Escherichia coli]
MNAYLTYDRTEERRRVNQKVRDEKDKWIDDRAQELIDMFPAEPLLLSNIFLPEEAQLALTGDKAKEAYNDYISAIACARAEEEWERKFSPCPF